MPSPPVALVTGASRGIGRRVAETLIDQGRRVIACARDGAALESFAAQHAGEVLPLVCDFSLPGMATRCFDQALSLAGHIDELVYAAGIVHYQSVGEIDEASLRAQHEVNFVSPFLLAQQVGVSMRQQGHGAMVLIASTLAASPAPHTAAYAASKAALVAAARTFALELAPHVRVNALAPGVIDTDMVHVPRPTAPSTSHAEVEAQLDVLRCMHPLRRLGTVNDVAQATLFLLNAPWVTGTVLTIDGGLSLK